jgi:hypothetical protein
VLLRNAATSDVLNPRFIEDESTIRAAAYDGAVVVVLAIIFPAALSADLVPPRS